MRLRVARGDDVDTLLAIRPEWTEFAARALLSAFEATPGVVLFVGEIDGAAVATIAVTPKGVEIEPVEGVGYALRVPENVDVAWLDDLHVTPDAQGRGVAVGVIEAALAEAKASGYRRAEGRTRDPLPPLIVDRLGATDLGQIELPDGQLGHCYGKDL